jgi:hypothetical protein
LARRPPALIQLRLTGWQFIGMLVSTALLLLAALFWPALVIGLGLAPPCRRSRR